MIHINQESRKAFHEMHCFARLSQSLVRKLKAFGFVVCVMFCRVFEGRAAVCAVIIAKNLRVHCILSRCFRLHGRRIPFAVGPNYVM